MRVTTFLWKDNNCFQNATMCLCGKGCEIVPNLFIHPIFSVFAKTENIGYTPYINISYKILLSA